MALPNWHASTGLALVRKDPAGEWFFVCWVVGANAIALEALSPGTHRYELWEVLGQDQSEVDSRTYNGPVKIGVIQMHK